MELVDHLTELRTRLIRAVAYLFIGMVIAYNLTPQIQSLLLYPLTPLLKSVDGKYVFKTIQEAFLLKMQIAFISGLVIGFPLIINELWGFIAPALTPDERKPVIYLAPFSVLLFFAGIGTAYACLPTTFGWMLSFVKESGPEAELYQSPQDYLLLVVKLLLAFGVSFQLPMILLFLARVGLITADLMTHYWRHATVGIAAAAAILTPSNDPITMMMMAVPMGGLYILSIGLVRAFEPGPDGKPSVTLGRMALVALMPVIILAAVGYWLWRTHGGSGGL